MMAMVVIHFRIMNNGGRMPEDLSETRRRISLALDRVLGCGCKGRWVGGRTRADEIEILCMVDDAVRGIDRIRSVLKAFQATSVRIETLQPVCRPN